MNSIHPPRKKAICPQLIHIAVFSSQCRRISCSPLEVLISTLHGPRFPMAHFFARVTRDIALRRNACFCGSTMRIIFLETATALREISKQVYSPRSAPNIHWMRSLLLMLKMVSGRLTGSILLIPWMKASRAACRPFYRKPPDDPRATRVHPALLSPAGLSSIAKGMSLAGIHM